MCYHVSTPKWEQMKLFADEKRLSIPSYTKENYEDYYHISGFARPYLPTLLNDSKDITLSRWKLLPFWVKNEDEANKYANTLNAKSEELFEKKSYSPYIQKHRGLLFVDGFFEPHEVKGQKETDNYYLSMPEHKIFALGIVVSPWKDQSTNNHYNTFSIITTTANELLSEIHNVKKRMPLIVPANKWTEWLNAGSKAEIENLMQPLEDGILQAWQVKRVTGARGENTNVKEIQTELK